MRSDEGDGTEPGRGQVLLLGVLAALILVPVTLPVPVLREFVKVRFAADVVETSWFMAINMVGAFLTAPIVGALADRFGRRKPVIVTALLLDAACFVGLTQDVSFAAFLAIRFLEGCAHITALSLLMSIAAQRARASDHGRVMGLVGAGITLGVAIGAPLGGILGRIDPLRPIEVGAGLLLAVAVIVALALRTPAGSDTGPRRDLAKVIALARGQRTLLIPLAYAFTDRFTVGFFTATFTLFLKDVYDLSTENVGMLLGLFLGPFFLLSYPFGRLAQKHSRTAMLTIGSALYGIGVMTLGAWDVAALPYLMVTLGTLSAVMFVPSLMLTTELAPGPIRSTALGAFNAAGSLGFIFGPLAGGLVSTTVAENWAWGWHAGYGMAFVVAGLSELLCVALTIRPLRRLVRQGMTT